MCTLRNAVVIGLLSALCRPLVAQEFPYSVAGPYKIVKVASVTLKDDIRGLTFETLVRHPDGTGPFPIVVFSHGALSNKDTFGPVSEHWASHGYVVLHPNHADARGTAATRGGTSSTIEAKSRSSRLAGGGLRGPFAGASRLERIKDITSVLNALDQVESQVPALKGGLKRDAIAVAGHSFGAYVAQCHGGVRTLVDGKLESLGDPRVKCVVPISAQGESQSYGLTAESWADARTPALHITGTRDSSAPDRPGGPWGDVSTKKVPFDRSPAGGKYLLVIEGANHLSFGGKLGRRRSGIDAVELVKAVSAAFLDAYLKQNAPAKEWLDGEAAAGWLGAQATLQRKL